MFRVFVVEVHSYLNIFILLSVSDPRRCVCVSMCLCVSVCVLAMGDSGCCDVVKTSKLQIRNSMRTAKPDPTLRVKILVLLSPHVQCCKSSGAS